MAVIKAVSSRASIGNALKYVTKSEKTEKRLISGIACTPETAIDEMKITKQLWGKADGRQYKHYVQSFPPGEKLTPQEAHEIALKLCENRFKGFEVIIATHKDKEHLHSHIIVNSVSFIDGRKIQCSGKDLQSMKDRSDELCKEQGLSITQKSEEITACKGGKYKALEKSITGQEYKSYLLDCYNVVKEVSGKAVNREDFIEKMKLSGYEVKWSNSRKHITFIDCGGNKIRNTNLEKTFKEPFGKEMLENGLKSNLEKQLAREQLRNGGVTGADKGADFKNKADVLKRLDATIGKSRADVEADERERSNRIADEQSRHREQNRIRKQKISERSRDYEEPSR